MGTNQIEKPIPSRLILNSQPFAEPSIMYSLKISVVVASLLLPYFADHFIPGPHSISSVYHRFSSPSQITPMKPTLRRTDKLIKNKP
jgi:hypothetical protein